MYVPPIAQEVKQEILDKIKSGEKVVVVAKQYGVSDKTIYDWLHRKAMGTVFLLEYLATFMDVYTREIVGWHAATSHAKELILEALVDAIKTLGHIPKTVHTDQGSEYCSKEYLSFLTSMGIQISMSNKASPWENGYQESFYNNFKTDLGFRV
ncbi:MAG: transposase [Verrucomicrobia bacterium]|nr:transposase [Verrucomicrobiota bacterium]